MPFDFQFVRGLQKECVDEPMRSVHCDVDHRLKEAKKFLELNRSDDAISLLSAIVEDREVVERRDGEEDIDQLEKENGENAANNDSAKDVPIATTAVTTPIMASSEILGEAYLLRGEAFLKKRNFVKARNDAQSCIRRRPNLMPAYSLLSTAEKNRGQFGKAEVALLSGLKFDAENRELASLLRSLRLEKDVETFPQIRTDDPKIAQPYLEQQQRAGNEMGMHNFSHLHPIANFIMSGDYHALVKCWDNDLVDFRYGRVENPLMHFPVLGIRRLDPTNSTRAKALAKLEDYKRIIDFLFEQGVRLDAKDKMGYTAVFHAVTFDPQPELLVHLLQKGADPDIQSILGTVALYDATISQNLKEVDILLSSGANPHIKDNNGDTTYKVATKYKTAFAVFDKHLVTAIPSRVCHVCEKKGLKRCIKCRVAFYCSGACQQTDWPAHKKRCKELVKGHKRLTVAENKMGHAVATTNFENVYETTMKMGQMTLLPESIRRENPSCAVPPIKATTYQGDQLYHCYSNEYKKKGNLLLKIQCGLNYIRRGPLLEPLREIDHDSPFMAYNEDRSFFCNLDSRALDAEDIKAIMIKRGGLGFKAYFWAFMEEGKNEIVVVTEPRIPAQSW